MLSTDSFSKLLRVFVSPKFPPCAMDVLKKNFTDLDIAQSRLTREEFIKRAKEADIICSKGTDPIDKEVLSSKKLKLVSQMAAGIDNIDLEEATRRKVLVASTHTSLEGTCADLIMGLMLACSRRIVEAHNYILEGKWTKPANNDFMGLDMHHKTMGIIGAGHIGQALGRRAKGFDMNVLYYSLDPKISVPLEKLLKESDFVAVCLPLTKDTRHFIGKHELSLMKRTAIIANIGRGAVIDTDALAEALENGTIHGAALDVVDPEPLPRNHKLFRQKNLVIAPHIGSGTLETKDAMAMEAVNACVQYLNGERISNISNPELYE